MTLTPEQLAAEERAYNQDIANYIAENPNATNVPKPTYIYNPPPAPPPAPTLTIPSYVGSYYDINGNAFNTYAEAEASSNAITQASNTPAPTPTPTSTTQSTIPAYTGQFYDVNGNAFDTYAEAEASSNAITQANNTPAPTPPESTIPAYTGQYYDVNGNAFDTYEQAQASSNAITSASNPPAPIPTPPSTPTPPESTIPPYTGTYYDESGNAYGSYDDAVNQTNSIPPPAPSSTFRPDFTQSNPYEGVTKDYIETVNKTFIPTASNPLPPYTGKIVAEDNNSIIVLDNKGNEVVIATQDEWDTFTSEINDIAKTKSNQIFEKENIKLPDGQFVPRDIWDELPEQYKKIGLDEGFDAMRKAIDADKGTYDRLTANRKAAIDKLADYRDGNSYKITQYLLDHPDDVKTLKDADFDPADIEATQKYVKEVVSLKDKLDRDIKDAQSSDSIFSGMSKLSKLDLQGLRRALDEADINLIYDSPTLTWLDLSESEKNRVAEAYGSDPYNKNKFASTIATINKAGSKNLALGILASPISAIGTPIAKKLTGQETTTMEWAVAGAMTATLAAPFVVGIIGKAVGSAVGVGIQTSATGIFVQDQASVWNAKNPDGTPVMSATEKKVAIAFDALMVVGIAQSAGVRVPVKMTAKNLYSQAKSVLRDLHVSEADTVIILKAHKNVVNAINTGDKKTIVQAANNLKTTANAIPDPNARKIVQEGAANIKRNANDYAKLIKETRPHRVSDISETVADHPATKLLDDGSLKYKAGELPKPEGDVVAGTIKDIERTIVKPKEAPIQEFTKETTVPEISDFKISEEQNVLLDQINRDNIELNRMNQPGEGRASESSFDARQQQRTTGLEAGRMTPEQASRQGGSGNTSPDLRKAQELTQRIAENREKLSKLADQQKADFTSKVERKLRDLGYTEKEITSMTDRQKLQTVIENKKAYTPESKPEDKPTTERPPEKGGSGRVATKEKVEVKPETKPETKTETKTKTKVMTDTELDKLMKEKTEVKPETKTKTDTETKKDTSTRTKTDIDQFVIPDTADGAPYYSIVWENGKVFVKLITPQVLTRGYVELRTKTGNLLVSQTDLARMTPEQAKRLLNDTDLNDYAYTSPYPIVTPSTDPDANPSPSPYPNPYPSPNPEPSPEPNPQPSPSVSPDPFPNPNPSSEPGTGTEPGTGIHPVTDVKPALQPVTIRRTPTDETTKRGFIIPENGGQTEQTEWSDGTIVWKQGKLQHDQDSALEQRWDIIPPPYDKRYTLIGKTPKGAKTDGRTPKQSVQVLGGVAKADVLVDSGLFDVKIHANSKHIEFIKKPKPISIREAFSEKPKPKATQSKQSYGDLLRKPKHLSRGRPTQKPGLSATKQGQIYSIRNSGLTRNLRRKGRIID